MSEPAARLTVLAHPATTAASALVFGDRSPLLQPDRIRPLRSAVVGWASGPEPAARQAAALLGAAAATVEPLLAEAHLGSWAGRSLADVAAADPDGLRAWLQDPEARPHGGETAAELMQRLRTRLDRAWVPGLHVWVVTPLVARGLVVTALGAPASLLPHVDVAAGGRVQLSLSGARWRLQELVRRV